MRISETSSYGVNAQLLESKDDVVAMFRAYLILRSSSMVGISRNSSSYVRSTAWLITTSAARMAFATTGGTRQALLGSAPSRQRIAGREGISVHITVASARRCETPA